MVKDKELDKDLTSFILKTKVYLDYAKEELNQDQIDSIDKNIETFFVGE